VGEKITEYQVLETMMLPSADNMADTLARWAFGSVNNYVAFANGYVKKLGLKQTTIADASGFSSQTISTAHDLVLLGVEAIKNPVLAAVVNEQLANVPVAGTVYNLNFLLGQDGVIGIKTGNTDEAGGCFLFAANRSIHGHNVTVVGVVMGAPNYTQAIKDSQPLISATDTGFVLRQIVPAHRIVGHYSAPWGSGADVFSQKELSVLVWKNANPTTRVKLEPIEAPAPKGQTVGTITVESGGRVSSVPVVLTGEIKAPSASWRIFH
jgi:D-alanyl-D-alanine carboxypeptidase (penicillin-binding protein 5/6)